MTQYVIFGLVGWLFSGFLVAMPLFLLHVKDQEFLILADIGELLFYIIIGPFTFIIAVITWIVDHKKTVLWRSKRK